MWAGVDGALAPQEKVEASLPWRTVQGKTLAEGAADSHTSSSVIKSGMADRCQVGRSMTATTVLLCNGTDQKTQPGQ
jgi:hypothetical protein